MPGALEQAGPARRSAELRGDRPGPVRAFAAGHAKARPARTLPAHPTAPRAPGAGSGPFRGRAGAALRREMEEGVPEVVDVLRATVAAGINPRRALQAAAEGAPPALEAVLGQAIRAAELGAGAGPALATAAEAEHLPELAWLERRSTSRRRPAPRPARCSPAWPPPPRTGSGPGRP